MPVFIREHVESDFDAFFDWQSDPAAAAFVKWLPKSPAECRESLRDAIAQQLAKP
jgi:hypothetical protein